MMTGFIPGVDIPVSRIFLGTGSLPENTDEWLSSMLEMGVNAIDTARVYQGAEEAIGRWLKHTGAREKVVILSKCCHPFGPIRRVNARAMREDLHRTLEALGTGHVDLYLLHRDDVHTGVGEIMETFQEMKERGQVRAFGVSNWTHRRIAEAQAYAGAHLLTPLSASSPNFSLAEQIRDPWGGGCVTLTGKSEEEARKWYRSSQLPVIAYSALGRGLLSGKMKSSDRDRASDFLDRFAMRAYDCPDNFERLRRCEEVAEAHHMTVPQIATAYLFHQGFNMFAVVSTFRVQRMEENLQALGCTLTQEECRYMDLSSDTL